MPSIIMGEKGLTPVPHLGATLWNSEYQEYKEIVFREKNQPHRKTKNYRSVKQDISGGLVINDSGCQWQSEILSKIWEKLLST